MNVTVWYSSESMADYIIDHTGLRNHRCLKRRLQESDASKPAEFHAVPDHIKKILYLDAPDIIVEVGSNPIFTIEESKEAGTGHNAFQRFSRLAASAENGIPSFYVYPEAAFISRKGVSAKWDVINPLIFHALERLMDVFNTPALLFFYPSRYPENVDATVESKGLRLFKNNVKYLSCPAIDHEMEALFAAIDLLVAQVETRGVSALSSLMAFDLFKSRRDWQRRYFHDHSRGVTVDEMSPLSAVRICDTPVVVEYIKRLADVAGVGELLSSRPKTVVYTVNAKFRGDPYPGALAAIDYMKCRIGRTFEDREYNLVMVWGTARVEEGRLTIDGQASVNDFCERLMNIEQHNLLTKSYADVRREKKLPRYYMQARYGSMFSKAKDIRVYSYFCDAILFADGVLWREG